MPEAYEADITLTGIDDLGNVIVPFATESRPSVYIISFRFATVTATVAAVLAGAVSPWKEFTRTLNVFEAPGPSV